MSSFEATPTPFPVTPVQEHATLPGDSTKHAAEHGPNHLQVNDPDRAKVVVSPALPGTPPPSSQVVEPSASTTPDSQPTTSHLTSPPPTIISHAEVTGVTGKDALSISTEQINQASPEGLRSIIADLMPALQEARTDAAHYRLQYQMLTIESADAVERIQVEMDMAQAELEVLQSADQQPGALEQRQSDLVKAELDPNLRSVHVDLYNAMVNEIQDLKARNMRHETTIAHQKRMIVQQESEIASMTDRIGLLRERLQENREHLNHYRRGSAAPDYTPRSGRSTPYRAPHRSTSANYTREQRPFAALLHATDLMSHGSPSTPTTPKRKRTHMPPTPITPQTVQPRMQRNVYETPQSSHTHLKVPMSAPAPRMGPLLSHPEVRRGHESDGTVSATDDSEAETEVPDHDDDVGESRASRHAADLLRTPTRPPPQRNVSGGRSHTQTKLFGQVRKSNVVRGDAEPYTKRARGGDSDGFGTAETRHL